MVTDIMILCKVVDNFGDIGVVYRPARALSDVRPSLHLTLVVSNLESFHALAPHIDSQKAIQNVQYNGSAWTILDWNQKSAEQPFSAFNFPFSIILECFQCGRPDWLEEILFADDFSKTVHILNIDYLTAEDYADEFHLLKSGTRKATIKKRFFMPGFTEKTGGLIINGKRKTENEKFSIFNSHFSIFFFAYDFDCTALVAGIADFQAKMRAKQADFSVCVLVAAGISSAPFESAWKKANCPFKIEKIPFLPQEEFDSFILDMDFLFVRGEDSLARACLSGIPFVWQAYVQDENYQLVKVNALLERMKPFFDAADFSLISTFWNQFNDASLDKGTGLDSTLLSRLLYASYTSDTTPPSLKNSFRTFSERLIQNGDLTQKLLAYMDSL